MSSKKTIYYISRKRLPNYNSIEEIFLAINAKVKQQHSTSWRAMAHYGAAPFVLIKNLWSSPKDTCGVYHITGDLHYMALKYRKQSILTIHDVHSALTGSFVKRAYVWLFWFWLPALFTRKITVISAFTKTELSAIIPAFKHKISVVHNPIHPKLKAVAKNFSKVPTILLMGTKPNKNLQRSLLALKDIPCNVVVVGPLSEAQQVLIDSLGISYINKTTLSFEKVISCYKQADIVCFPSTYEGFGMPIIEAQTVGRVVLSSNIGATKEIAGTGAHLVDPYSVDAIREGILKIMKDPVYRDRLIEKGFTNAAKYSLEQTVESYVSLYNEF